ncbi:MAG: hypothetical protein DHS20C11_35860 [Lysobacteraceae bacterium]|nr:MAG: hypothetical protein DHS20C11_35860 [Xanthomonadaceae bacterium]
MGLLDELEKEAERRQQADADEKKRRKQQMARYRNEVEPTMERVHEYLSKLCDHVNYLQPVIRNRYEIPGYGPVRGAILPQFELSTENTRWSRKIRLNVPFQVDVELSPEVLINGERSVKSMVHFLQSHRLGGNAKAKKDPAGKIIGATFRVQGKLQLSAEMECAIEEDRIKMAFVNFDELGKRVRHYTIEQIDDDLLDQIGRFLTREDNSLLTEQLAEDVRKQLQMKIEQERMKKQWEDKLHKPVEAEPEKPATKVGALGRVLSKLGRK